MAARTLSHGGAGESSGQDPVSPLLEHPASSAMDAIPEDIEQDGDDFPEPICGGCRNVIDEDSADAGVIHFATQLWHVDCFRCAKCQNLVSTDRDDILLLSDGHPICGQCNYNCQICGLPIMEEAIMTGDESYHASCFTCRSCHSPIDDLVFAKTSQGIYCMPCHNQRVARSRRHAENKKRLAAAKAAAAREAEAAEQAARDAAESRADSNADSTMTGSSMGYYSIPEPPARPNGQLSGAPSPSTAPVDLRQSSASPSKAPSSAPIGSSAWLNNEQAQPSPPLQRPGSAGEQARRNNAASQGPSLRELRMGAGTLADRFTRPPVADAPVSPNVGISSSESTPVLRQGAEAAARETEVGSGMVRSASEDMSGDSRQVRGSSRSARPSNSRDGRPSNSRDGPPGRSQPPLIGLGIEEKQPSETSQDLAPPSTRNGRSASVSSADASGGEALTPSTSYRNLEAANTENAQLKRASRLSIRPSSKGSNGTAKGEEHKSRAFSFYDPDFIDLMDSFGRIGAEDDEHRKNAVPPVPLLPAARRSAQFQRGEEPASPPETTPAPPELRIWDDADEETSPIGSPTESTDATTEESGPMPVKLKGRPISLHRSLDAGDGAAAMEDADEDGMSSDVHGAGAEEAETKAESQRQELKIESISERMRESIETARDGHVSMDTTFVESVLRELEATKEQMKLLQNKHDHLRRASRHAAMGFSSAKAEYEQELEARFEAENEMLRLKRQLADQAAQLASMSSQRQKEAEAERRSQEVKDSLQGMERDLAKLTVERDLTVAEVAGLVAIQKGREPMDGPTSTSLQRSLTQRMEGVKEKYRHEIGELTEERDALLIEIEELKQSREIFLAEAESLNARNEELNKRNAQLMKRVEQTEATARQAHVAARHGFAVNQGAMSPGSGSGNGSRRHLTGGAANGSGGHHSLSSSIDSGRMVAPAKDYAESLSSYEAAPPRSAPVVTRAEAPPKKFKWMKPKISDTVRSAAHNLPLGHSPPVPPKSGSSSPGPNNGLSAGQFGHQHQPSGDSFAHSTRGASGAGSDSGHGHGHGHSNGSSNANGGHATDVIVREHLFQPHNALRPVRCLACQKNMWGQSEYRCAVCGQSCHSKCLQTLATSCQQPYSRGGEESSEPAGPSMFGRSLSEQTVAEGRDVPHVVERCVQAVEKLGMDYEGIYRKSGGTSQLRIITQLFERGQVFNLEDGDRFNDVSAITSVLKNYFRELPEPLLTFELHEGFIEAAEMKGNPIKREALMDKLIRALPRANFATLRYLVRHLHRVQQSSSENRMNARNLGVVFGPTLMRSSDPSQEFAHMGGKAMTIEYMIENPNLFDI